VENKIIELLKTKPYNYKKIKGKLKFEDDNKLKEALYNLELTGKIYLNEDNIYTIFPKHFRIGKLQITKAKNAIIVFKDGSTQHINKENLNGALNYDTVIVNMNNIYIDKVLAREFSHIVCEVKTKENIKYLEPYNVVGDFKIRISSKDMKHLNSGDRIIVDVSLEKYDEFYEGNILKVIGNTNEPDVELKSIAISNGFETEFNEDCINQLKSIPQVVTEEETKDRLDLRDKIIFTIDGKDTKDMDDAISIKKLNNGNYLLGVHIADVTHYVKEDTPLYEEAKNRGTSLYMANSVIPMLPSELSNGICSLNPKVDRLTLSCLMEIDKKGNIRDYKIRKSVINSKMKMNYDDVNKILNNEAYPLTYEPYKDTILLMKELSEILTIEKEKRGYLRFANTEIKIIENKDGQVTDIKKRHSGLAEELIENFMVMANSCVATHLGWIEFIPSVYRNHGIPDFTKVNNTIEFISNLGYRMRTIKNANNALVLQKILEQLSNKEEFPVLSTLILKSMQRAEYSTHNIGHFALELPFYTHFTSPIRRFPDLQLHKIVKEYTTIDIDSIDLQQIEKTLQSICHHSSLKERQADKAELEAEQLKITEYMSYHLNEEFTGFITDITDTYIQIQTQNGIPGIIEYSTSHGYKYDRETKRILNEENKPVYKIGHSLLVMAKEVNREKRITMFDVLQNITLEKKQHTKKLEKTENN